MASLGFLGLRGMQDQGLPSAIGFGLRLIVQQIQLRAGFWSVLPLQILHLAAVTWLWDLGLGVWGQVDSRFVSGNGDEPQGYPVKCNHGSRRVSLEAVLGLIYGHQEWGVVVEIAAVMGLDPGPEKVLS